MIKIYYYNKCGTSRKAKKFFDENRIPYEIVQIIEEPPTKAELKEMVQKSGVNIKKFFNTSGGSYRELGMKDKIKSLSEDELLDILASDGKIIKRPLITNGEVTTVGWNDGIAETWLKFKE
ncbi:arsenate reductase family protein [Tepidibacillus fermentans]|uniref:Arsenate reductase n=1 Tax=Tepidibacillus fermentans TaxID=1281767 RepID=A0A4R3K928_9BACI|nr:arsenate reductase family protein [Tepidibacillus fermentans]TCS79408.1 arsenate reductase [Tepidibacillus fermentans]